jgi:hypothetical protein
MIIAHRAHRRSVTSVRSIAIVVFLTIQATLAGAQDFQIWNEVDLTASWKKIDFLAPLVARTDPSKPNPQFAATGIVALIPLTGHLQLVGGYLFADLPQSSQVAHVPVVAVAASLHAKQLTVIEQNRLEKLFDYEAEPVRYRNLLLADVPFEHGQWHSFVSDEIFFNLSNSSWNQNRFQAGAGRRLSPRLRLDFYYLQRNASGGAAPAHVLGTILTVRLTHSSLLRPSAEN